MIKLKVLDYIALLLLIIGGINWGLVGLFNFDLVATLFGQHSSLSNLIYIVVGGSAIYCLYLLFKWNTKGI